MISPVPRDKDTTYGEEQHCPRAPLGLRPARCWWHTLHMELLIFLGTKGTLQAPEDVWTLPSISLYSAHLSGFLSAATFGEFPGENSLCQEQEATLPSTDQCHVFP